MSSNPILSEPAGQVNSTGSLLTNRQAEGVEVLVIVSILSLSSVTILFSIIIINAIRNMNSPAGSFLMRSQVAAYFLSMLITDSLQAIGSIMSMKWIQKMGVDFGGFCMAQGAVKQVSDVGNAIWVSIIAIHTFSILFLGLQIPRNVMFITTICGWCIIGALVSSGPFALEKISKGPFFGTSGYWCWISDPYTVEKIVLDYMWMFSSACLSFILYMLVFLKLRGNIVVTSLRHIHFRLTDHTTAWKAYPSPDAPQTQAHIVSVAKHMLLYPIAYTILILPIGICRFAEWTGHEVPLGPIIFSDCVFLLSGLINTILFVTTRPIVSFNTSFPMFRRLTGASVRRKGSDVSFSASISSTEKGSHSEIIEYNKAVDILDNNVCTDLNYQDSIRSRLIFERRTSDGELPINMDQEKGADINPQVDLLPVPSCVHHNFNSDARLREGDNTKSTGLAGYSLSDRSGEADELPRLHSLS